MTPPSSEEKQDWIERTLLDLREGHGSAADAQELRLLLMSDREARLIYLRNNQLDGLLEMSGQAAKPSRPSLIQFVSAHRGHLISATVGAGIAAVLTLLAVVGPFQPRSQSTIPASGIPLNSSIASLQSAYHAVIEGNAAIDSGQFGEGEVQLDRGIAQLAFRNGAQIVLEGKCGFEIIDEMTVTLTHGKMWAHCPETAYGFKVLTPGGRKIIDLGTEFGIEVSTSGATDVHVFDGLVDVVSSDSAPQRLEAGSALSWTTGDALVRESVAEPDKFVSADSLASKRFLSYRNSITSRDDLLLYYDFANPESGRCRNTVPQASDKTHGLFHGAIPVRGRFDGSKALQFEHPGDRVELEMADMNDLPGISIGAWLKIERFDSDNTTILNSNNWDPGAIHFQINKDGRLKSSINGGPSVESEPGCVAPGKWHFVAASWNFETKKTQIFCDGRPVPFRPGPSSPQLDTFKPRVGHCQIGAWKETRDYKNGKNLDPPRISREFRGRIDEVMIFDHVLSAEEVANLHAIGTP